MESKTTESKSSDMRATKNILMILGVVALGVASGFTIAGTAKTADRANGQMAIQQGPGQIQAPPAGFLPDRQDEKTDSDSAESEESDEKTEDKQQTPPGMPGSAKGQKMPDQPGQPIPQGQPGPQGQMPSQQKDQGNPGSEKTTQLVIFSVEAIAMSLLIIYLIMSGFNKKSLKDTFKSSDKILVFVLSSIVLSAAIVGADVMISNVIARGPQTIEMQQLPGSKNGHNAVNPQAKNNTEKE